MMDTGVGKIVVIAGPSHCCKSKAWSIVVTHSRQEMGKKKPHDMLMFRPLALAQPVNARQSNLVPTTRSHQECALLPANPFPLPRNARMETLDTSGLYDDYSSHSGGVTPNGGTGSLDGEVDILPGGGTSPTPQRHSFEGSTRCTPDADVSTAVSASSNDEELCMGMGSRIGSKRIRPGLPIPSYSSSGCMCSVSSPSHEDRKGTDGMAAWECERRRLGSSCPSTYLRGEVDRGADTALLTTIGSCLPGEI
ncbi:unnamed protein product [Discosporangium mesarthrocarpum]